MRNSLGRIWNMEEKREKREKNGNNHCRIWIMARKLKNMENETQTW
jgi:hypothetical protein